MKAYYADLPAPLQDTLSKITLAGKYDEGKFYKTEGSGGKVTGIVFGVLGLGAIAWVAFVANGWDFVGSFVASGIASLFMMLIIFNWFRLKKYKKSRMRPGIIANPLLMGIVGMEHEVLWFFYHIELLDHQITHHLTNGSYRYTSFFFKYKSGTLNFNLNSKADAEALMAYLRSTPAMIQGWVAAGTADAEIVKYDWPTAAGDAPAKADGPRPKAAGGSLMDSGWIKFAVSCAAGLLYGFTAYYGNLTLQEIKQWNYATSDNTARGYQYYIDYAPFKWHRKDAEIRKDDRSYEQAVLDQRAGSLRKYIADFPQGRHTAEARQNMVEMYKRAEEDYVKKAPKADPQAAAGIRALLANLREKPTPQAFIKFVSGDALDDKAIDAFAKKRTNSNKIRSMGPSFTPERNRERESRILAVMKASFRTVFSDDLFDLVEQPPGPADARFLVAYKVEASGMIYTWDREESLPMSEREVFIGMQIRFTFTLQVPGSEHPVDPNPEKGYAFVVTVKPAPNFDVVGEGATAVYDRMAATSFDKFEIDLANAYGLERKMPEDWGKLPDTGTGYKPRVPRFDPSKFKMPDLKVPEIPKYPDLLKKDVASIIRDAVREVGLTKEPTIEEVELKVQANALIYRVELPEEDALRTKIKNEITVWKILKRGVKPPPPPPPPPDKKDEKEDDK